MGYSGGLYRIPKYNGQFDTKSAWFALEYNRFNKNDWAKEKFGNSIIYAREITGCKVGEEPDYEKIAFFVNKIHPGEYNDTISDEIAYFGSGSCKYIHDWFEGKDLVGKELSKEQICEFMSYCMEALEEFYPESCVINDAFREIKSDGEDDGELRLIPCDGVEVTFDEDGASKRYYTSDSAREWGSLFYVNRANKDFDDSLCLRESVKALIKALATMDFEQEAIYYEGGW